MYAVANTAGDKAGDVVTVSYGHMQVAAGLGLPFGFGVGNLVGETVYHIISWKTKKINLSVFG